MSDIICREIGRDAHYKIWHRTEKNMFIFVHSGSGSIVTKDKSYPMEDGTLCFIGQEKYHYTFPDIPEEYERSKIFISSGELRALLKTMRGAPQFSDAFNERQFHIGRLSGDDLRRVDQIFDVLDRTSEDSDFFQAELYSAVLQLTVLLCKNTDTTAKEHPGAIQTAVEYINDHIKEDLTIDEICSSVYMSKYYFCRLFKEKIGLTVMEYILKTRIMMAKELLSVGTLSITDVSETCAFSSVSYFSRVFKSETGVSPLHYKKYKQSSDK